MNKVPEALGSGKEVKLSDSMSSYLQLAANFKRIRKIGPRFQHPVSPVKGSRHPSPDRKGALGGEELSTGAHDNISIDEVIAAKHGKMSDAEAKKIVFHSQTKEWMKKRRPKAASSLGHSSNVADPSMRKAEEQNVDAQRMKTEGQ